MPSHFLSKNDQLLSSPLPTVRPVPYYLVQYRLIDRAQTDAYKRPSRRRKPWGSRYM